MLKRCCDTIAEMYFIYHEFSDIIHEYPKLNDKQKDAIVRMFIIYFGIDKYHEKAKIELIHILEYNDEELANAWSSLFNKNMIDLSQDREFVFQLMTSKFGAKLMFAFARYLERHGNLLDYSDIIISMAYSILDDTNNIGQDRWLIEKDLINLVWGLYDEVNSNQNKREDDLLLKCLDIWDVMFEKQIGGVQELTRKMMEL